MASASVFFLASNFDRHEKTSDRLEVLRQSGLLDTPSEEVFDRFTLLASKCLGVPVALVSLVAQDRQFFKSQIGLAQPWAERRETPLTHSFCQHVVATGLPLVVEDAPHHPLVQDNLAIQDLGVMAYAGVPLQALGQYPLGALCAIDTKPRQWSERDLEILTSLGEAVTREIDLRFAARQFDAQVQELAKVESLRDDMVQMLIHDLRTPLSSLLGGLQTLDSLIDNPDPATRQMLDVSLRGGRSLAQMVSTILDVSRGEAGLVALDRKILAPEAVIQLVLEQVEQLRQQQELTIDWEVASDLPPLWADEEKLRRVLVNLVGNAIQHTPRQGRIDIRVIPQAKAEASGQNLLWCVCDTGHGIAPEDHERIFDKFGQASSRKSNKPSTGLGLTFCKLVVESHGGRIWVESTPGQGSNFFFTLPVPNEPLQGV